jgi:hypothetical protein
MVAFLRLDTKQIAGPTFMTMGSEASLRDDWWESKDDQRVVKVCYAPSNGWFLRRRKDGQARYKGLPASLARAIDESWKVEGTWCFGTPINTLSVGHNGEWFVLWGTAPNRRFNWNGVHPTLKQLLAAENSSTLCDRIGTVQWVELGPDGTFVAHFDRYTAWYGNQRLTEVLLSCM